MKTSMLSTALVAALMTAAAPAWADRTCSGNIGAETISENLVVAVNSSCRLNGTRINGNLELKTGAKLTAKKIVLSGNLESDDGFGSVDLDNSQVSGNVDLDDGGAVTLTSNRISGNIDLDDNRAAGLIRSNQVAGNIEVENYRADSRIERNQINGNLKCDGNRPAPTGGNNQANGNKEQQCQSL